MISTVLASILLVLSQSTDDLFTELDRNNNGLVTAEELNESQMLFFRRALRVADANEDGGLTRSELSVALDDPKPVDVHPSMQSSNRSRSYAQLDRNKDGRIVLSELPESQRQRIREVFDNYGSEGIPVASFQRVLQTWFVEKLKERRKSEMAVRPDNTKDVAPRDSWTDKRAEAFLRWLDLDQNNVLTKVELAEAPYLLELFDRNKDGRVSREELFRKMASTAGEMNRTDSGMRQRNDNRQTGMGTPNGTGITARQLLQYFTQIDKDGSGSLTMEEVPERVRSQFARFDRDKDKKISREEFLNVNQQRQNRSK